MSAVESAVAAIRVEQAQIKANIEANTRVTNSVKNDTEEIVELIKGAGVLARLGKWVAAIAGGYLAGKGLKWW